MKKKNNKGFSLIELIIAIAILVILTGLLAPQFMKYIEKSREAKDMQSLDTVYSAVQGAFADEDAYKDFVTNSEGSGAYKDIHGGMALTTLLGKDDNFAKEVKELLGVDKEKGIKLSSKAAGSGNIAIVIKYVVADDNPADVDGLQIAVYVAGSDLNETGNLSAVGNPEIVPKKTSGGAK